MEAQGLVCDDGDATQFAIGDGEILAGLGIPGSFTGEIQEVGDGLERIVDLVGDGAGEAAYGGQLLGLHEGQLGAFAFGDVDAEDDDSGDGAVGLAPGLIDEVEEALFERVGGGAGELDGGAAADEGFAGPVDLVEQGDEALSFGFGDGFANRFADQIALAHELLIERIDHLEDVFGAAEEGEEGGRLLEEVGEPFALLLEFLDEAKALLLEALAVGDVAHEGLPAAVGQDGGAYFGGEGGAALRDEVPLFYADAAVEQSGVGAP